MPRLLLDTGVLLWALEAPHRLPVSILRMVADRANEVTFSAASIWEIAIKSALRRADFRFDPYDIASDAVATGFVELPVTAAVAARVADLPPLHRDPFDRLLVTQAMAEPARMLTSDKLLEGYSELVLAFDPR